MVRMPTSLPLALVIGTPEMRYFAMLSSASRIFWVGRMVIGSTIIPDSLFLTLSTSMACSAMVRFLWMKPIPPSRAMQMAVRASVTVSMAALTRGMLRAILRDNWVVRSTSRGRTSEWDGTSMTSSNVSPSGIFSSNIADSFAFVRKYQRENGSCSRSDAETLSNSKDY